MVLGHTRHNYRLRHITGNGFNLGAGTKSSKSNRGKYLHLAKMIPNLQLYSQIVCNKITRF